jgi:hypothetical protein
MILYCGQKLIPTGTKTFSTREEYFSRSRENFLLHLTLKAESGCLEMNQQCLLLERYKLQTQYKALQF